MGKTLMVIIVLAAFTAFIFLYPYQKDIKDSLKVDLGAETHPTLSEEEREVILQLQAKDPQQATRFREDILPPDQSSYEAVPVEISEEPFIPTKTHPTYTLGEEQEESSSRSLASVSDPTETLEDSSSFTAPTQTSPTLSTLRRRMQDRTARSSRRTSQTRIPSQPSAETRRPSGMPSLSSLSNQIDQQPYNQPIINPIPGSNITKMTKLPPGTIAPSSGTLSRSPTSSTIAPTTSPQSSLEASVPEHCKATEDNPFPPASSDCPRLLIETQPSAEGPQPLTRTPTQEGETQPQTREENLYGHRYCMQQLMPLSSEVDQNLNQQIAEFCTKAPAVITPSQ